MRLLLDTHAFLWWIAGDTRLSSAAFEALSDGSNEVFLSVVVTWEVAIKARLGRLDVPNDLASFLADQISRNVLQVLPVLQSHALRVYDLPDHHRDPFDRLLVAQAMVEKVPIVSGDRLLAPYEVTLIW